MAHTLENVLHSHGIAGTGDTLTDNAREAGLMHACLGCGSVVGIDPSAGEPARVATRDAIAWEDFDCCEDADDALL